MKISYKIKEGYRKMCLHVLHSYHTLSFFLFSHFKFFSFLCHSFHLPNLQNQTSSKPIFQKLWIGVSSKMIIFENKSYDGLMTHVETTLFMDICYLMWKSNDAYYQQKNMLESSVNSPSLSWIEPLLRTITFEFDTSPERQWQ